MKKNFKSLAALGVVAAISLSMFAGCSNAGKESEPTAGVSSTAENFNATGFPIVNETVTKKFMIRKPTHIGDPSKMLTLQEYEKKTNVKIEWDVVSSDGFQERVNLVMASNSMPDAILKGVPDITKTSADGSIVDISGLIDQYSTGLKSLFESYPEAKAASLSPDGKIYSIPNINSLAPNKTDHKNMWINKKWLDNLGLEVPKTLDEFVNVLKAFRDKDANGNGDPNDEIPYVVEYSGGDHMARTNIFSGLWGIYSNMGYPNARITDHKVEIYSTSDKFKEVLQFMNMLYKEKLLDNSIYTQTSDVALSKFNSDRSGSFGLSSDDLWNKYSDDYIALAPPANSNGDTPVIGLGSTYAGPSMVITKADKTPEITLRWIDYFYTEEGANFIGGLTDELVGKTCQKLPDGSFDYTDEMLKSEKGVSMALGAVCPLPGGGFPYWRNENNSNFVYSKKVKESVPVYESYYQKDPAYAYPVFTVDENEKVNDIRRDLDVYLRECEAKFITGELSFDKWDEYVKTCEKMKIKDLESYFQSAYNRMN